MKSQAQKRRLASPQHRRSSIRRRINKARLLLAVLGALSAVLAAVLALMALIQKQPMDHPIWRISLAYLGGGGILLVIRALLNLPKRIRRRQSRSTVQEAVRPRGNSGKDGMVLVLVLVLLGITATLLLHVQFTARIAQQADLRLWQNARLRTALTDEAFHLVRALANDEELAVDHLEKPWAGARETVRPDGLTTISRVTDLNRYVDLNNLVLGDDFTRRNHTERFLQEAMTKAGDFTPIDRIEAVTDWISPDDEGIRGSEFYRTLEPPYRAPNTWMHTWNELQWIYGFTPEYFARKPLHVIGRPFTANITDLLTIIPGPRSRPVPININTAPSEVLESVFGPAQEPLARYIYLARADRPFRSVEALLAHADQALFAELESFIDVRSTHFLIDVRAFEGDRRAGLRAVVHREPEGRVHILQWTL